MFHDDVNFPGEERSEKEQDFPRIPRFAPGHFALVSVTPHFLSLVDLLIARSGDFDRALAESIKKETTPEEDCASQAYGDLVRIKGKLVEYVAALMDLANDPNLNRRRTSQVRFK